MDFNESSNLTGLTQDVDFICGTDSTSFPLKDKARLANRWLYKAVTDLISVRGRFEFDDTNLTDFPVETADLVSGQADYQLPAEFLKLIAVEVQDQNGNWTRLQELDKSQLKQTITDFEDTNGLPKYYDVMGNSLILYPAPSATDTTLTAGIKLHHIRKIDEFVSTDTTQSPGIPEPFHRIVSLGVAYDWLLINGSQDKTDRIRNEIEQLRTEMKKFEGDKNRDKKVNITIKRESYK